LNLNMEMKTLYGENFKKKKKKTERKQIEEDPRWQDLQCSPIGKKEIVKIAIYQKQSTVSM